MLGGWRIRIAALDLAGAGCRLALDDVVPELPGLEALIDLPFAALKIDRSIVHGARRKGPARDFILRIGTHARANGQKLIAEGIEEPAALEQLREVGCDVAQGYLLGRPGPGLGTPVPAGGLRRRAGAP